ncbi:MAG: Lrp/AsnC family transcriptional regulator [Candidatus Pacearchaeota archaeon]|jgi:DNA-binding Lrp family transcriptional regulator
MWLTKHEKEVLKLLLNNAKLSDTSIAEKLNISSQAVGKIRKRLEEDLIKSYTLNLDLKKLGVSLVALVRVRFGNLNEKDTKDIEARLMRLPEVNLLIRTMSGEGEYIVLGKFRDINDLNRFVEEKRKTNPIQDGFCVKEIIILPIDYVLKHSSEDLYNGIIDVCGTKHTNMDLSAKGSNQI